MECVALLIQLSEQMTNKPEETKTPVKLDDFDRKILLQLQKDATWSMDRLAKHVGVSKTAAWNRVQRMQESGVIKRQVSVIDPRHIGLQETFFIAIKTNQHQQDWLEKFDSVIHKWPQIIAEVDLYSVTSSLSMEVMKHETALPIEL